MLTRPIKIILVFALVMLLSCAPSSSYLTRPALSETQENGSSLAMYHYSLGVLSLLSGNVGAGIKEYETAFSHDPGSAFLASELASLYIKTGQHAKATELCEKALVLNPRSMELHLLLGGLYLEKKDRGGAEKEFRKAIEIDPSNAESYLYIAIIYLEGKRYEEALQSLQGMLKADPSSVVAPYYISKVYLEMKRYDDAESWLQKTIAAKPSFEAAWLDLGALYELQNKNEQAIGIYKKFTETQPSRTDMKLRLAKAYLKAQEFEEASSILEELHSLDPSSREVRFTLGLSYFFNGGDIDKAISEFSSMLEEDPGDEKARYFLASSYEEKKNYDRAIEEFRKIPSASELHSDALIHIGAILKKQGKTGEAVALISEAIKNKDADPELYSFLASIYQEDKKFVEAEDITAKGLKLHPDSPDLHYRLGAIYEGTNRFEESIRQMEEVLKIDPDNADALNFIGYSYADRGIHLEKAEEMVEKAHRLKPKNGYIMDSLGWVYFRQERMDLALKYLREAARLLPDDPTVFEHLGDVAAKSGQEKDALDAYKRALDLSPANAALQKKIEILLRRKK